MTTIDTSLTYTAGEAGAGLNDYVAPVMTVQGEEDFSQAELEVYADGTLVTTGYTFTAGIVTFDNDRTAGDTIELRRVTDSVVPEVVFPGVLKFTTRSLNKIITQLFLLIQEVIDGAAKGLQKTWDIVNLVWVYDLDDLRVVNVGDAIDSTDAVNVQTMNAAIAGVANAAGLGAIAEGTLATASGTIELVGNTNSVYLTIAGSTFYLTQGLSTGGGTLVYNSSTNRTVVTFDSPIYGAPHQYIAITFSTIVPTATVTAGLDTIVEGTLALATDTITLVGDIASVYLTIAGSTFHLQQSSGAGGGSMVYASGTNLTTITFDDPIYGAPHKYIAMTFVTTP